MARIRTVKPELFTDLKVAELAIPTMVTFIGLLTHVDDEGRAVDDARLVKAAVWPLRDEITALVVEGHLGELAKAGLIRRYRVAGSKYLLVANFLKHQKINRPTRSKLPPPEERRQEDSLSPHGALTEDSMPEQGTGNRERNREATALVESGDSTPIIGTISPESTPGKALVRQRRGVGLNLAGLKAMLGEIAASGEEITRADERRDVAAGVIFAYWASRFNHLEAKLDGKRLNRTLARLREADDNANVLLFALDGARKDNWIMGTDPQSTRKYDGIETIFRDWAQVERFAERGGYKLGLVHPAAQKYLDGSGGNQSNGTHH